MSFYNVSNLDIKMAYIANESRSNSSWREDIFVQTKFFADFRARKYSGKIPMEEAIQESHLGLWSAIISFDYQKNFDFYRWAQWNISKQLRNSSARFQRNIEAKSTIKKEIDTDLSGAYNGSSSGETSFGPDSIPLMVEKSKALSNREKRVVFNRFIFGKTLSETGKEFGLTAERIRQVEKTALKKLRKELV